MLLDVEEISLARLCHNFRDQESHPVSIYGLLPNHSIAHIENGNLKGLGKFYHNLVTDSVAQKNAL